MLQDAAHFLISYPRQPPSLCLLAHRYNEVVGINMKSTVGYRGGATARVHGLRRELVEAFKKVSERQAASGTVAEGLQDIALEIYSLEVLRTRHGFHKQEQYKTQFFLAVVTSEKQSIALEYVCMV